MIVIKLILIIILCFKMHYIRKEERARPTIMQASKTNGFSTRQVRHKCKILVVGVRLQCNIDYSKKPDFAHWSFVVKQLTFKYEDMCEKKTCKFRLWWVCEINGKQMIIKSVTLVINSLTIPFLVSSRFNSSVKGFLLHGWYSTN